MKRRRFRVKALTLVAIGAAVPLSVSGAATQPAAPDAPAEPGASAQQASPTPGAPQGAGQPPSYKGDILTRTNLLGGFGGLRTFLSNYGVTFGLQDTNEVFGNATGGVHTGAAYDGATLLSVGLDAQKALGWDGATFNISAWQLRGRNLSTDNLRVIQSATEIEAERSTRLWELWYQQSFLDGALDLKLGQQSIDQEFIITQYGGAFINAAMGWPAVPTAALYGGGPAFPLSSLGARVRAQPAGNITVLGGVFDDNPPGGPFNDDSQVRGAERTGTLFNLNTGALFIAEVQYAINQPATGDMDRIAGSPGLPGTYKLGGWFDTGSFPDPRFDNTGVSLANPASNRVARMHHGNFSFYGVADQMVWRPAPNSPQSVGVFARLMGAPQDRNLLNFSVNGGMVLKAPFAGRDNDSAGVGVGMVNIGGNARGLDQVLSVYTGTPYPVRSSETFVEVTYQFVVTPWLLVQPDFQYFFTPGGGVPNPNAPGKRIGNEAVFGLHTNVVF